MKLVSREYQTSQDMKLAFWPKQCGWYQELLYEIPLNNQNFKGTNSFGDHISVTNSAFTIYRTDYGKSMDTLLTWPFL